MQHHLRTLAGGVLAFVLCLPVAHADDKAKYKAFADDTRREVWALRLPEFKQTAIPEAYRGRSAVIVAAYHSVEVRKEASCRNLYRMLVHINDKVALKAFSEFDYHTQMKREYNHVGRDRAQQVLGVRVIKPDGTVHEVDADDYLSVSEGKKEKEERTKLAVPGLEVGDDIDIFFFDTESLHAYGPTPFSFDFMGSYPMLSCSSALPVTTATTWALRPTYSSTSN